MVATMLATFTRSVLRTAIRAGARAERLYGGPVEVEGQRLDPEVHAGLVGARVARLPRLEDMLPPAARAYASRTLGAFDCAPRPMARVIDAFAPGERPIPVRIYQPHDAAPAMLLWFHGGGGVIGSIQDHDAIARMIAHRTGCVVASVGYRLGPEDPHPAAIDDAVAAWRWACGKAPELGVDVKRIGVGGDSFGGLLAAWVERRARDENLPRPAVVGLVYPLLDLTMSSPSVDTFADGFLLTRSLMHWFREGYAPDPAVRRDASPIFLPRVAGASPTVIVTAGFDPLRDEGRAWADRLELGGAHVVYRCETDLVHGFLATTGAFRRCDAAAARLCEDLGAELLR
jgi:acetyl esterase